MKIYIDFSDWWIGVYRGPNHWYACPLPCLVIRWNRRRKPAEPPEGVRIVRADGTVIPCGVLRDESMDSGGNAYWAVHPLEPYTVRAGDEVLVDVLPARTTVSLVLVAGEGG